MTRRFAAILFVLGLGALVGAGVPFGKAWQVLREPPLAARSTGAGPTLELADVAVEPGLPAELVVILEAQPGAPRQRASLDWSVRDAAGGDAVAGRRVEVGIGGDEQARAIALGKFHPPEGGRIAVSLTLAGAAAGTRLDVAVHHGLKDHTFVLTLALFMAVAGVVALTAGVVGLAGDGQGPSPVAAPAARARRYALFCHLAGLAGYLVPFANVAAPLAVWLAGHRIDAYIDRQGREALNFQLSVLIYLLLAAVLSLAFVGLLLLPVVVAFHLVTMVVAALRAAEGREYRYPLTFRFVR